MNKLSFLSIFVLLIINEIEAQGLAKFVGPYAVREVVADIETSPVISNEDAADDINIELARLTEDNAQIPGIEDLQ